MKKHFKLVETTIGRILAIAGLVALCYSGYRALSLKQLQKFSTELDLCNPDYGNWLDFLAFSKANNQSVVLLDVRVLHLGDTCNTRELARYFETKETVTTATYVLSAWVYGVLSTDERERNNELVTIGDNGANIKFLKPIIMPNRKTTMRLNLEGIEEHYSGPYNVSLTNDDMFFTYEFTVPDLSDELGAKVECSQKNWSYFRKVFGCPLL